MASSLPSPSSSQSQSQSKQQSNQSDNTSPLQSQPLSHHICSDNDTNSDMTSSTISRSTISRSAISRSKHITDNSNNNESTNQTTTTDQRFNIPLSLSSLQLPKPVDIVYNVTAKAPLLIGWDDEKFHALLEEHRIEKKKEIQKLKQTLQQEKGTDDDDIENKQILLDIEEKGFGLQKILSDAAKSYINERTNFDDLKSDLKKIESSSIAASTSKGADKVTTTASERVTTTSSSSATSSENNEFNINIREMKLYQNLLNIVKYQRDSYIMGNTYADTRKEKRQRQKQLEEQREKQQQLKLGDQQSQSSQSLQSLQPHEIMIAFPSFKKQKLPIYIENFTTYEQYLNINPVLPPPTTTTTITSPKSKNLQGGGFGGRRNLNDQTQKQQQPSSTLALQHLTTISTSFIPSPTMHNALLYPVLWTLAPPMASPYYLPDGGPLRKQIVTSTAALIPLSQSLLDRTMKNSIIWFMTNSKWKDLVKGSTANLVGSNSNQDRGDGGGGGGGNNNNNNDGTMNSSSSSNGKFVTTKTVSWDQYPM